MALSPRKIGEGLYQPLADINVTPLVDVMLVLLIIFMVTAPMLATGIKVNLPSAKTAQPLENKEPVVVAVAKDGSLSVGREAVSRDELADKVKAKLTDSNGVVQLRGDRDASYGDVVSVMDELAANGVTRIAIVSGPARIAPPTAGCAKCADSGCARRASSGRASRAGAVTLATLDGRVFEPPPLRPPWLRPLVIAVVIALHAAALSLVYLEPRPVELPREVVVDIQPEAPPAETPAPPAEQAKPDQPTPPPAQDAAPAPTEPPPPTPVTPPVAEQPPPPPVDAQPPLPTRGNSSAACRNPACSNTRPSRAAASVAGRGATAACAANTSAPSRSGRACAASFPASAPEDGRGSAAQAPSASTSRSAETRAETGAEGA